MCMCVGKWGEMEEGSVCGWGSEVEKEACVSGWEGGGTRVRGTCVEERGEAGEREECEGKK